MSYLEELLPEFRKGARIRKNFWDEGSYIYYSDGHIFNEWNKEVGLTAGEMTRGYWELYKAPGLDWQYIIDHKCLCWFWERDDAKQIKYLTAYRPEEKYPFVGYLDVFGYCTYSSCRPVRRDEVTFYEDREYD